jgi:hypothetical protein
MPREAFDLRLQFTHAALHRRSDKALSFDPSVVRCDGWLVFSIEHPIFMASRHPGFRVAGDGQKTWPVESYQMEGRRVTNWLVEGVVKQHRTIGTLVNLLLDTGFTLKRLNEWGPTDAQIEAVPELAEERERSSVAAAPLKNPWYRLTILGTGLTSNCNIRVLALQSKVQFRHPPGVTWQ